MNEPNLIRRTSITYVAIMKQKKFLMIAILCVVILILGTSYALLTNFDQTEEVITFQTGNLNITVNDALVTLNGNLPENDTIGLQNATPITLTLTNTGTMFIEGYDVKLVSDLNKNSTLNEDYIKYAISEDGISYSNPKILTSNENIIFSGYELEVDESKTIYLKVWIDEASGNQALGKEYYGSIKVDLYQKKEVPEYASDTIKEVLATRTNSYILEDDIYYVSGEKDDNNTETTDDIDFNYVWYSGKLWRITAIYPDGSMKMITDDMVTAIAWGATATVTDTDLTSTYSTSYVREWLNQEFLPTLYNYENIIDVNAGWYSITDSSDTPTKPTGDYTLTDPVGLLNTYEYNMSCKDSDSYLNIGYYWHLITPYSRLRVWYVDGSGNLSNRYDINYDTVQLKAGIRPSIVVKSTVYFSNGTGTINDPFLLTGDIDDPIYNTTLLNTRVSGEYVKLEGDTRVFRIVDKENIGSNLATKITLNDYVEESGDVVSMSFGNSALWNEIDLSNDLYFKTYLNTTWLNTLDRNMLEKGTYYLGTLQRSYKSTVCATVSSDVSIKECIANENVVANISSEDYVGLLRAGEMFASQFKYDSDSAYSMWLITPDYSQPITVINAYGFLGTSNLSITLFDEAVAARPTIHLKSTVVIKSGSGTEGNPFVVGLPS